VKDLTIIDNVYDKENFTIQYHKGTVSNKSSIESYYFEALLPCVNDIIVKRFYTDLPNYSQGISSMLQSIMKMESKVTSRSQRRMIKATVNRFKVHCQEIYNSIQLLQLNSV
jgi:hypothetical protein